MSNKLKIALFALIAVLLAAAIALGYLWNKSEKQNADIYAFALNIINGLNNGR